MAKYSDIKGFTVQTLASDPVDSAIPGGTWASGGALNTARNTKGSSAGTQTQSSVFGGQTAPGFSDAHEQYNGTAWTETTEINTARYANAGAGTYTSALCPIGVNPSTTRVNNNESWNGSSWTELADLSSARFEHGGRGNATNNLVAGGQFSTVPTFLSTSEEWNAGLSNKQLQQVNYGNV